MMVELTKTDLVNLVMGTTPSYEQMNDKLVDRTGSYRGSYGTWSWDNHELNKLSEKTLWDLYKNKLA
jgi:hypothetical protein